MSIHRSNPFFFYIKNERTTEVALSFLVRVTGLDGLCPSFAMRTPDYVQLRRGAGSRP